MGLVAELPSAVSTKYRGLAGRMPHGRLEEGTQTDLGEDGSSTAERIADQERPHESFGRAIIPRPSEHDFSRTAWVFDDKARKETGAVSLADNP